MQSDLNIFYLLILLATWFMCSRCSRRKLSLAKSPAINPETIVLHASMLTISSIFVWSLTRNHLVNILPAISVSTSLLYFYVTETSSEGFWRKNRNLLFAATVFGIGLTLLQLLGTDARILSAAMLMLCIHKAQISLGGFYRQQIQDFGGVKDKLLFIESSMHNAELINARHHASEIAPKIDKAV